LEDDHKQIYPKLIHDLKHGHGAESSGVISNRDLPYRIDVDVCALHSLGHDLVQQATQCSDLPLNEKVIEADQVSNATRAEVRRCTVKFTRELLT
jgi:hypothetical protein